MADLKIGDTVRLKSGGPLMTISGIGTDNNHHRNEDYWLCEWFDGKKPAMRSFNKEILIESDDDIHIGSIDLM